MLAATLVFAGAARAQMPAAPIPQAGTSGDPAFVGAPATPDPFYEPLPPRHPFMAPNGYSEIHSDAYQSDVNPWSGPLGRQTQVLSTFQGGDCGSVTFDSHGRIVTVCVRANGPTMYMFDPATLATLASFNLPPRQGVPMNTFQDFTGGGYFYMDNQDRAVVATTTHHVYVVAETPGPGLAMTADYDVSGMLSSSDRITSALPDWTGRIWVESFNGTLVTIDPATGSMRKRDLGEETENSFAIDEAGAVYVVSIKALYQLRAAADGTPKVIWRTVYPNSGIHEPGQVDAGSGTTPTIQGAYVTITDNADPLDIAVYRRSDGRQVCLQPIFSKGMGSDENSLIGAGNMMIAENNWGYTGPTVTQNGGLTAPGIERVDINGDGKGCHVVWVNNTERVPTVVSKVSLASGLLYTYTKDDPAMDDPWYFTALDAKTGRLVYEVLAGTGIGFNNNYAPVTLGTDGTAYVGTLGGLIAIRDATPPNLPAPLPPGVGSGGGGSGSARTILSLRLKRLRGGRLRVSLTGSALRSVTRATLLISGGKPRRARRRHAPFSFVVGSLHRGQRLRLRVVAQRTGHRQAAAVPARPAARIVSVTPRRAASSAIAAPASTAACQPSCSASARGIDAPTMAPIAAGPAPPRKALGPGARRSASSRPPPSSTNANDGTNAIALASRPPATPAAA